MPGWPAPSRPANPANLRLARLHPHHWVRNHALSGGPTRRRLPPVRRWWKTTLLVARNRSGSQRSVVGDYPIGAEDLLAALLGASYRDRSLASNSQPDNRIDAIGAPGAWQRDIAWHLICTKAWHRHHSVRGTRSPDIRPCTSIHGVSANAPPRFLSMNIASMSHCRSITFGALFGALLLTSGCSDTMTEPHAPRTGEQPGHECDGRSLRQVQGPRVDRRSRHE